MDISRLIVLLLIGAAAGWLAGLLFKGRGFGLLGDVALGVAGAFIGRFVLGLIGIAPTHWPGLVLSATLGALLLLGLIKMVKRA